MYLWVLWATLASHLNPRRRGHQKLQSIACQSEVRTTTWACSWLLKLVGEPSWRTEPLSCGIWFCLWIDSIRIELNSGSLCWNCLLMMWDNPPLPTPFAYNQNWFRKRKRLSLIPSFSFVPWSDHNSEFGVYRSQMCVILCAFYRYCLSERECARVNAHFPPMVLFALLLSSVW